MRLRIAFVAAAAAALACAPVAAAAAQDGNDPVPEQATLSITVPTTVNLGSARPGDTVQIALGQVRVNDRRAIQAKSWTTSVSTTGLTTGAGSTTEQIPSSAVGYYSGPATSVQGAGIYTPGQPTPANEVALNATRTAFSRSGGSGNNSAFWNPTIKITIPESAVAGTYTGTVTHTVL